ncbi:MAG: HRDC domain-containing protein [Actinomycetales bacterium]|nr:HRDC domain-containing protein [Actinomycetales bacterium]
MTSAAELQQAAQALRQGHGPVALDAERASGHRYGQRAYLIQIRRAGAGTFLIDPVAQPDLGIIDDALAGVEWVLHAASQDLACLEEVGLHPRAGLFDTELAARLLGRPRVGLGPLVADVLGLSLAKEHSAVDWSTRPLRRSWLVYAALDVEVLLELADALRAELTEAGKDHVLQQECAHVIVQSQADAQPKPDPWRRTSGLHKVRGRRGLAVVQALWQERDQIARIHDVHPSRILPDAALVAAALALPTKFDDLDALPEFSTNGARRNQRSWWRAVRSATALADDDLPSATSANDAPPPPRSWAARDPQAWARLEAARTAVAAIAQDQNMPVENLLKPDLLRRLCWQPPQAADPAGLTAAMLEAGARPWQVELVAPAVAEAWVVARTDAVPATTDAGEQRRRRRPGRASEVSGTAEPEATSPARTEPTRPRRRRVRRSSTPGAPE